MPLYRAELLAKKPLRYAALIHDVSQVLYLPFDWDDGSYARDRSGHGFHGTIYGATRVGGKIGMALSFDGMDDYVEVEHFPELEQGEFSVALWFKLDKTGVGWTWNVGKGWVFNVQGWFLENKEFTPTNIETAFRWSFDGGREDVSWRGDIYGKWIHVLVVYSEPLNKAELWINGELKDSKSPITPYVKTTQPLRIEGRSEWTGIKDEVLTYNRALSQDEIRMLMYRRLV